MIPKPAVISPLFEQFDCENCLITADNGAAAQNGMKAEETHASRAIQAATLLTEPQCRSIFIRSCQHRTSRLNRGPPKPAFPYVQTRAVAEAFDSSHGAQLLPQHRMTPSDFIEALLRITTTICYNAFETITTVSCL